MRDELRKNREQENKSRESVEEGNRQAEFQWTAVGCLSLVLVPLGLLIGFLGLLVMLTGCAFSTGFPLIMIGVASMWLFTKTK